MDSLMDQVAATGRLVDLDGVGYYRVDHAETMDPFLMTVVSDSDLWMFVSSSGALTAGRVDADHSLFPYETDDRLHRAAGITGPVTIVARTVDGRRELWRPFDPDCSPGSTRSIAKSVLGDRLVLEETNPEWGLTFRATWAPSAAFGWVRTAALIGDAGSSARVEVLDGLLDVMPPGVGAALEQIRSNLVDAYKRSETGPWGPAAIYNLESRITDRAEPAEALEATVVWSMGFPDGVVDLDERSVAAMLSGRPSKPASLLKGRRGAYLLRGDVTVPAGGTVSWVMVADIGLDHSTVLERIRSASAPGVEERVAHDLAEGSARLRALLADADAFQETGDPVADAHHTSNVLFNSMRGGVFPYVYRFPTADLVDFLEVRNRGVHARHRGAVLALGEWADIDALRAMAEASGDPDFVRLALEYLPLTFSRRHGDPSRPWNRFTIRVKTAGGDDVLSYEGNWRDIFQNWEALLHSFPRYFPHVVAKFVNASTVDGNNPYRISRDGIDWEVPDPSDPWSHIGYWGDHQIVYLLRLLEAWEDFEPGGVAGWLDQRVFAYADVPYAIAGLGAMLADPRNTITYDEARADAVVARERSVGTDGRLVVDGSGTQVRVGLAEKLLVPALAKLSSYVPGGGIWLNTQRPEWNDANNALAGFGLSMVTLYHLRRYLGFVRSLLEARASVWVSAPVAAWFRSVAAILESHLGSVRTGTVDDRQRRALVDGLVSAAADYRSMVRARFDQTAVVLDGDDVARLCTTALEHLDSAIAGARRADGLYDAYNLVSFGPGEARVDRLGPMLEGQVAVLSSGALDGAASLAVVDALFDSAMYRPDQDSFMLYPVKTLPPFLERNRVPDDALQRYPAIRDLIGRDLVFDEDVGGVLHFGAGLANDDDLKKLLDELDVDRSTRHAVEELYEEVFAHHSFTGRSSSMYGYEGIGSIYWHMVAKLLVAVHEAHRSARERGEPAAVVDGLSAAYRRIRSGLGFRKDPANFGAIPTDCYSHSPGHAGAQQPGMTGQVKEEILTRFAELGLQIGDGRVSLGAGLIDAAERFPDGGTMSFGFCGVPVHVRPGNTDAVRIVVGDEVTERAGCELTAAESAAVFGRAGSIDRIEFTVGRPGADA